MSITIRGARASRGAILALLGIMAVPSFAIAEQAEPVRAPTPPLPGQVAGAIRPDIIRTHVDKLCSFGTRHTLSETDTFDRGIGGARQWLQSAFEDCIRSIPGRPLLRVGMEVFDQPAVERMPQGGVIANVWAALPGTMPEASKRVYYVVAHYDTIPTDKMDFTSDAPGANDDASGVAALLEIARVLSPVRLDATIMFLATAGEEQGLLGARYHAAQAAQRGDDIRAVLNNDIVGDPSPGVDGRPGPFNTVIRVFSEGLPANIRTMQLAELRRLAGENDSPSRQLARYVRDVALIEHTRVQPKLVFRPDRFLRGGDHLAFADQGWPAVRFTVMGEDYNRQHQDVREESGVKFGDRPEFVDAEYLADVARLNAAVLVHLANAPREPANVRIITAKLETGTTLRWEKCPEPDTAGYEVVWRDTTSPYWEHAKDVGDTAEAHMEISKDNVYFGVRAYDREGYRSPVSFAGAAGE